MKRIAVVDTMFSRADLGSLAKRTLEEDSRVKVFRKTVPGIKDLPVACKILLDQDCDLAIALGMPGSTAIDKQCAHEASMGLMQVQLLSNKHIFEVFIHEDEGRNDKELREIMRNRTIKHSLNALDLLFNPDKLIRKAGTGERQGKENAKYFEL